MHNILIKEDSTTRQSREKNVDGLSAAMFGILSCLIVLSDTDVVKENVNIYNYELLFTLSRDDTSILTQKPSYCCYTS